MAEFEFHEAANIFPLDEENLDELAKDIAENGQQVPIEILDGEILDGRRRYLACGKAGVEPKTRKVLVGDPIPYVLSLNLHRRHLTTSQRAMAGARAKELYAKRAEQRKRESGKIHGRGRKKVPANLPEPIRDKGDARDQVAKAMGISGRTVDKASQVLDRGTPELVQAVDEGSVSVDRAAGCNSGRSA